VLLSLVGCQVEPTLAESPDYNPNPLPDASCAQVRWTDPESGDPADSQVIFQLTQRDPEAYVSAMSTVYGPVESHTQLVGKQVHVHLPSAYMDPGNTTVTLHYCGGETQSITLLGWAYL